jgi:hypothetical protein
MLRFKLGLMAGFAIGWAVGSGKAASMMEELRQRWGAPPRDPLYSNTTSAASTDRAVRSA